MKGFPPKPRPSKPRPRCLELVNVWFGGNREPRIMRTFRRCRRPLGHEGACS